MPQRFVFFFFSFSPLYKYLHTRAFESGSFSRILHDRCRTLVTGLPAQYWLTLVMVLNLLQRGPLLERHCFLHWMCSWERNTISDKEWKGGWEEVNEEVMGLMYCQLLGVQSIKRYTVNTVVSIINSPFFSFFSHFPFHVCFRSRQEMFFYTWNPFVLSPESRFGRTLWAPWSCRLIWPRHGIMMISPNEGLPCCHGTSVFTQARGGKKNATFSDPWMNPRRWGYSKSWAGNNFLAW